MIGNIKNIVVNILVGAIGGAIAVGIIFSNPDVGKKFGLIQMGDDKMETQGDLQGSQNFEASEQKIIDTVALANPAVVSIIVTKDVPIIEQFFDENQENFMDPFDNFFGTSPFSFRIPQYRQNGTEKKEIGGGSGFLVSNDGMIVTNRHVVDSEDVEYTVFLNDGTKFDAKIIARDPVNDLAIIKIDGNDLHYLKFSDSDDLKVGQSVIAIGNALSEFRNTVSVGIVSGLSRSIQAGNGRGQSEQLDEVIQTDAAINPGNSGGPLLNLNGEVIGVNVAVALGGENIGFALPVNLVRSVVQSVQETGEIARPFLGIRYVVITPQLVEKNDLPVDFGVLVLRGANEDELAVIPGSAADKAGIVEGDIILELDGVKLIEDQSLGGLIRKKDIGDIIQLKIYHKGEEKNVTLTLEKTS